MPIPFYNIQTPVAGSTNTITKIAVDFGIRDFLLHKNINNPVKYPQLSTTYNGAPKGGEPVLDTMMGTGSIINQPSIESVAITRMEQAVSGNRFINTSSTTGDISGINTINYGVGNFPNSTPTNGIGSYSADINGSGLLAKTNDNSYRLKSTTKNLYIDETKQTDGADELNLQPSGFNKQLKSYADEHGVLNIGGSDRNINIVRGLLSGEGVGIGNNGLVSNFDFRGTLASRVLSSTGIIQDTKLGVIGGRQLALALANNVAFNLQQSTISQYDLNPLHILKNGGIKRRDNYTITVGDNKVLNIAERILGFQIPKSQLDAKGSIFSTESRSISNTQRANSMLENTGNGQQNSLVKQFTATMNGTGVDDNPEYSVFRSGYVMNYQINKEFILKGLIKPKLYAYGTPDGSVYNFLDSVNGKKPIPKIDDSSSFDLIGEDGLYATSNINFPTFTWASTSNNGVNTHEYSRTLDTTDKKSLLAKTQILFNSNNMMNIVSRKGMMNVEPTQLQTAVVGNGISKGNAVKKATALTGSSYTVLLPEDTYCRSWTTYDRYKNVNNLVRGAGLNKNNDGNPVMGPNNWRINTQGSVLGDSGFVKIGPYKNDTSSNAKKFMLSIENLAWAESYSDLPEYEKGTGDLLTGKKGRIMWFPPYDVNFTENTSTSWESTNFIGRGEAVHTYNNTDRSGTLSFKVIVDHQSQINGFAGSGGPDDDYIDSYFAGCQNIDDKWLKLLTGNEVHGIEVSNVSEAMKISVENQVAPEGFSVYFLNDVTHVFENYEDGTGVGFGSYSTEPQTHNGKVYESRTLVDNRNTGLNQEWIKPTFKSNLKKHLKDICPNCSVIIKGYASSQGFADANKTLSQARADNFYKWFQDNILDPGDSFFEERKNVTIEGVGAIPRTGGATTLIDANGPKGARRVEVSFKANASMQTDKVVNQNKIIKEENRKIKNDIKRRFYNESSFFEEMTKNDPFIFDTIREKIKYFHPAFHSTTPEGLNSRLTFLNQCMRQGPTLTSKDAKNLAFGAPPVCILRLGDFYNTKIIIENIGFDFEQLWDINPEGVGVQPMIASVNISFKFIGGSSLESPINKLQNALSFNYYANTQVYDVRADYIVNKTITNDWTKFQEENKQKDKEKTDIKTDQVKSNETVTKEQESKDVTTDDFNKISIASLDTDSGTINVKIGILNGLSKEYEFKAFLYDSKNKLVADLGSKKLDMVNLYQLKIFKGKNNLLVVGENYTVILKFINMGNKSGTFKA